MVATRRASATEAGGSVEHDQVGVGAGPLGLVDQLRQARGARDLQARAVEQPCRARAERPVHERLHVAGAQQGVGELRHDVAVGEALGRPRLPHAQRQLAGVAQRGEQLRRGRLAIGRSGYGRR
jgi:hypothetical protein